MKTDNRKALYDGQEVEILNIDSQNYAAVVFQDGKISDIPCHKLKLLPRTDNNELSKRELFAAMAMQGILASGEHRYGGSIQNHANYAVNLADALIKELNK